MSLVIQKILVGFGIVAATIFAAPTITSSDAALGVAPLVPNTADSTSSPSAELFPTAPGVRTREDASPVRVVIPSIGLDSHIQNMGVLQNKELDVPSGATNDAGWYQAGTVPGELGSAVFDAHVFAAFKNLHKLKAGDDIYVVAADGKNLHFVVEEAKTYLLADVSKDILFNRADLPRLNLITCAGKLTPDRSTYDHRLIVYAVLAD